MRYAKKGAAQKTCFAGSEQFRVFLVFIETMSNHIQQRLACYEATYTLNCLLLEKIAEYRFFHREWRKISFLRFSRKVSTLGYMLLHNANINVAIAHILLYRKSLYDLQKPIYKKSSGRVNHKNGRGQKRAWPRETKLATSPVLFNKV